jgi:hypothetical protein
MEIQHEIPERAFKASERTGQKYKPCTCHLGGPCEIHLSKFFAEFKMLSRGDDGRRRTKSPREDFDVVGFVGTLRDIGGREIRERRERILESALDNTLLFLPVSNLLLQPRDLGQQRRRALLILLGLGCTYRARSLIPLRLRLLQARLKRAQFTVARKKVVHNRLRRHDTASRKAIRELGRQLSYCPNVMHGASAIALRSQSGNDMADSFGKAPASQRL